MLSPERARELIQLSRPPEREPKSVAYFDYMGNIAIEMNRPWVAERYFRKAIKCDPKPAPYLWANLGWALRGLGRLGEARTCYRKAEPRNWQTWLGLAYVEEEGGNYEAALAALAKGTEIGAPGNLIVVLKGTILFHMGKDEHALAELTDTNVPHALSLRGRIHDKHGRYDLAWEDFVAGKAQAIANGVTTYPDGVVVRLLDRLDKLQYGKIPKLSTQGAKPIFIFGWPRSGTTKMERQIAESTPGTVVGGELPFLNELVKVFEQQGVAAAREQYLANAAQVPGLTAGRYFTDKMPLNETFAGLVRTLFPSSPIFHVIRHPLDVIVSCMGLHLSHGFFCATALESLVTHYVRIDDLVQKYLARMEMNRQLVRYENLVENASEPSGLAFHSMNSASVFEARKPAYKSAINRYKNYLKWLEPIVPRLLPIIERQGYSV